MAQCLDALAAGPLAAGSAAVTPSSSPWVVDLLSFSVPPPAGAFRSLGGGQTLFVPYAPLGFFALATFVVRLGWRERSPHERRGLVRLCLVGMATFALLSLGTHLHFDGYLLPVPLPFALLAHLPGFADTLPERMRVLVAAFSSLLVGVATEIVVNQFRAGQVEALHAVASPVPGDYGARGSCPSAGRVSRSSLSPFPCPLPSERPVGAGFVSLVRSNGGTVLCVPAQVPWTADWGDCQADPQHGSWCMYADAGLPAPEGYVSELPFVTTERVDQSTVLPYVTLIQLTNPQIRTPGEVAAARALPSFLRRLDVHSVVFRTSELAHAGADGAWFAAHAGAGVHRIRSPGGLWVLSVQPPRELSRLAH